MKSIPAHSNCHTSISGDRMGHMWNALTLLTLHMVTWCTMDSSGVEFQLHSLHVKKYKLPTKY